MFSANSVSTPHPSSQQKRPAPSLIGADVIVTGILQSQGDMQVDGRVEGNVRGHSLVIGENAEIHGEIAAESVTVRGRVEGSIRATRITLAAGCFVDGDIVHKTLEVELGARLNGRVRNSADPLADILPLLEQRMQGDELLERRRPGSPMREAGNPSAETEQAGQIAVNG